jgi:hypothetical protein
VHAPSHSDPSRARVASEQIEIGVRGGVTAPVSRGRRGVRWAVLAALAVGWLSTTGCEVVQPPPTVEHELVVSVIGSGAVASTPSGIDTAAGVTSAVYARGTTIRLDAVAGEDAVFEGFTFPSGSGVGCRSGTVATTCIFTLETPVTVTVAFGDAPIVTDPEQLTVVVEGSGGGRVWTVPVGIDTTVLGTFEAEFERGETVTVNASPNVDSSFDGFSVTGGAGAACESGSGPTSCVVTLDLETHVTATFRLDETGVEDADRFDLVATIPVAGGQIEFALPGATSVASLAPLSEGIALRTATTAGTVRVAWIGDGPLEGPVVRLVLDRVTDPAAITLRRVSAFAGAEAADAGAGALRWRNVGDARPPAGSLLDGLPDASADAALSAWFADHRLGDLDANGVLDARDALQWLERLQDGVWTDFERYHADLDGDDVIDADDLALLLDKLVDPTLPARLHVKPVTLSFAQLDPAADGPGVILAANLGSQAFSGVSLAQVPSGTAAVVGGELEGYALGLELSIPQTTRLGWMPGFATVQAGSGDRFDVRLGHLVVLIAGQSNAVGWGLPLTGWPEEPTDQIRMLGNDYRWKDASEPLDVATGQLDSVSVDLNASYSFGTRLGHLVHDATGFETYLIPTAKGGTQVSQWLPPSDPLDRRTLFGSASFRGRVSAGLSANPVLTQAYPSEGGPVNVLVWYQGESDSAYPARRAVFVERTNTVMNRFDDVLDVPVIYVQLASHERDVKNREQHAIGELQRSMETSYGGTPRPRFHMVPSYDLPRSDGIHLSAFAQRVLAERIDLAVRQHVLGEDVDGTGPRLESLSWSGTNIRIRTTHVLASGGYDPAFFTVFDGPPAGDLADPDYGANVIPVNGVGRDPSDTRSVLLQLSRQPTAGALPHVRYMPPAADAPQATWNLIATNVVRASGTGPGGVGLPLPTFGPLAP